MIIRTQDLFLSILWIPPFGNRASQMVHQMKIECADSSPTQERTSSAKELLTPTASVLQEVSSPVHMPHPARDAPSPLACLSSFLACQRLRFWFCPCLHLLVSAWSKSAMLTQGARGKESICVAAFRVGKMGCAFLFPPSITPNCQMSLALQLKGRETRWGYWSSFILCMGLLLPLFLFAWKYQSLWQRERRKGRVGEREEMMVREDRLFPG